ncbi:MAG: DUF2029 domain-containing protein [Anaerolineaceae bacterium]|jgi:hypothetical protein|nr:MAG: DUF2029 domain-containing protein [Anaerolineaceae bacterium]
MSKPDFAALVALAILSIALAGLAFSFGGMDLGVYYAAARVTLQGGNPYDYQQLAPQIVSSAGRLNNPYYYAPWFTWMVAPLALFSYNIARALWAAINFVLWFWSLFNLSALVEYPRLGWRKWGMWLLVTFVFAWSTWGAEQVGILILFLFTLILLFIRRENWTAVGMCLAVVLFKPNITALPAGMIALWLLLRRKTWKPILFMFGTVAALMVISLIITPGWYVPLFDADKIQGLSYTLDETGGLEVARYTTTLTDWLAAYGVGESQSNGIYGFVILLGAVIVLLGLRYSASALEFLALAILVNFMAIPYALFYDYPPLTITLFYGNFLLLKSPSLRRARYAANAFIVAALFVGDIIPYRYWITIILLLLVGVGYFASWRNNRPLKV